MTVPRPLSASNPRVARVGRLVRRGSARAAEGVVVVEGPTLLAEARAAGWSVREVFVDAGAGGRPAVAEVVGALPAGLDVWELPDGALARVGDAATPQGVLAVVAPPAGWADDEPDPSTATLVLALVDVADPGNAGTLLRAAEAAGAGAVSFLGASVDPTNPKCVRSSAGALFHVPARRDPDPATALARLRAAGFALVTTVVRDGRPYDEVDLTSPVALVLGSEAHGLPAGLGAVADEAVTVPMAGRSESLNVAMAGSVIMFEALRQRRRSRKEGEQ